MCQYGIKEWRQEFPLWLVWPRFNSNLTSVLLSLCLHLSVVWSSWPICCLSVVCARSVPVAFLLCLSLTTGFPLPSLPSTEDTVWERNKRFRAELFGRVLQGRMLLSWHNSPRRTLKTTQMLSTASTCRFQHLFGIGLLSNCWLLLAKDCHNTYICYSVLGHGRIQNLKLKLCI